MKRIIVFLCLAMVLIFCTNGRAQEQQEGVMQEVIEAIDNLKTALLKNFGQTKVNESARFKLLADGWVLDKTLGIEWGPSSEKRMKWSDANKYAKDKGGRLPTVQELRSLVDYERHEPAIDTTFFKDTESNWYWTATECNWDKESYAWCVGFGGGGVGGTSKDDNDDVRPCRASVVI